MCEIYVNLEPYTSTYILTAPPPPQCQRTSYAYDLTQTDLTINDIAALEEDYQCRIDKPPNQKKVQKGYPSVDEFSGSKKILHFYTGISSFTVLMAIFNLVSAGIPDKGICKLSKFEYFTLVLMKLRLHASNCDLAFRFGISESTVSRIFVKWIEAMDIRLLF